MPRFPMLLLLCALIAPEDTGAAESLRISPVHLEPVVVELDREALRTSGSRVGIGSRRAARIEAELAESLRTTLERSLAAQGIALAAEPQAGAAKLKVRASRVRLHPIADDLATPLASYGRSEAGASLVLELFATDGRLLLRFAQDYAAPDPGELRPQSAIQSRKALEALFARFALEAGRRIGGAG